jgi:hypothetical protein
MSSFILLCFGAPAPAKIYNNFISFSLVSRDAHTAGNPPSSICSPLSLPVKGGAQAAGLQQLDFDGIVYLKLLGVVIGSLAGPLGFGNCRMPEERIRLALDVENREVEIRRKRAEESTSLLSVF